jgi:hypothetical protein
MYVFIQSFFSSIYCSLVENEFKKDAKLSTVSAQPEGLLTINCGRVVNIPASYSEGPSFKSRPGHRLS